MKLGMSWGKFLLIATGKFFELLEKQKRINPHPTPKKKKRQKQKDKLRRRGLVAKLGFTE